MAKTLVDIDDEVLADVMRLSGEPTKKSAVNRAIVELQRRLHLERYFDAVRSGVVDDLSDPDAMRGARR